MMHFCTIADKKYMLKGLAMLSSLTRQLNSKFQLHWLCLDQDIYDTLTRLQDDYRPVTNALRYCVKLYLLSDIEKNDPQLLMAKSNPPSRYGTQQDNYCWCLTPYFTHFILKNEIPDGEYLTYVDSDIFFYRSPEIITECVDGKPAGIHTHRFGGVYDDKIDTGWFNVGVVVFKKDSKGLEIASFWKQCMLNTDNLYYNDYGTCGDQKYLNLFLKLWGKENICVFDEESDNQCGHLAPWNCTHLQHPGRHIIINKSGIHELVVFFHFSHFTIDETGNEWSDSINGEWNPVKNDRYIHQYYEDYFEVIRQVKDML